jgi:uncharacterized protein involved in response to NO
MSIPHYPADAARSAAAYRAWEGAAIFRRGFRTFFLAAGLWAVIAISLWPFVHAGQLRLATAFSTIDWHAHEMIFGYLAAVVAGFLTTAVPNWTGRLPVSGAPLAALAGLWVLGRVAMFESAHLGRALAGALDCAFLIVFAAVIAREVIAGKNGRNGKVVALVGALALANVAYHVEDAVFGFANHTQRAALGLVIMLILVIGGRVTPSFTNNWLTRAGSKLRPAPFGRFDLATMAISGLALAAWVVDPYVPATGALALAAGVGNLVRLSRWHGWATRSDVLVLVLHAGFGLASVGFLAVAASAFFPAALPYDGATHVWAIGATGVMTLAMMTRATLGHSGQPLAATRATKTAYSLVGVALILRIAMSLLPQAHTALMHATACAWALAFGVFVWSYWPMLAREPRLKR